ncbi:hypothetical protein [Sinorhizobium meliloti]|uniref:hypothetical protein n=1 Tax=Rhizobium meliloti TaxID=382 RepID=UPI00067E8922|nr:hypothetical protein [Sinorhizobium meliloti]UFX12712.1 hypothetical protein SmelRRI128_25935 [Sinorhizobium meliloti]
MIPCKGSSRRYVHHAQQGASQIRRFQVLTEEDYSKVMNESLSRDERIAAFNQRHHWLRSIMKGGVATVMMRMIKQFGELGIVEVRPGIKDDPDFPEQINVESLAAGNMKLMAMEAAKMLAEMPRPLTNLEKAGWESQEQFEAFRAARVRNQWRSRCRRCLMVGFTQDVWEVTAGLSDFTPCHAKLPKSAGHRSF